MKWRSACNRFIPRIEGCNRCIANELLLNNEKPGCIVQPDFDFDPWFYFSGLREIVGQLN